MDESQIDHDLNQLSNDSAKLLYLINYIYEKGKIDLQQKRKLKEFVCQEKELVFNLLNNSKDINKFIESAKLMVVWGDITKDQTKSTVHKALISSLCQNQIKQQNEQIEPNEDEVDEMKSPQGNLLLMLKLLFLIYISLESKDQKFHLNLAYKLTDIFHNKMSKLFLMFR